MFNARLKYALDYNNMKAIELAERLGIHRSIISKYLSGQIVPKGDRLHKMSMILNVREDWLLGYDVPMERPAITSDQADEILNRIRALSPERQRLALSLLQTLIDQEKKESDL